MVQENSVKQKILIIAGPTASGKTSIGIECAKIFNGEIISSDSMQIYKKLDIGTAKVTRDEKQGVPHYMIDVIEPNADFSVSDFCEIATQKINSILKKGKLPIIVGGTGLYIDALLYSYDFSNTKNSPEIRERYTQILNEKGAEHLHSLLKDIDPESYQKLHVNDTKRIIRSLEIFELSGGKKSNNLKAKHPVYDVVMVVLDIPREQLYNRINLRVDKMILDGVLDELKELLKQGAITKNSQSMQAIGYKELIPFLEDTDTLKNCMESLKQNTRNYAKRQITYFKSFKDAIWLNPLTQKQQIFEYIEGKLQNGNQPNNTRL